MHQSSQTSAATPYSLADQAADRILLLSAVQDKPIMNVHGFEAINLGERFSLFFKEFNLALDKRLAVMSRAVNPVDFSKAEKHIKAHNILFVKNGGVEILTPQGYRPGMANLAAHTKGVNRTGFLFTSLKTETSRLYSWIKEIIKTGRMDRSFQWTVTDFDTAVQEAENFLKGLPTQDRQATHTLSQVYVSFDEAFSVMNGFNNAIKCINGRDVEVVARELTSVYELGVLLVKKINVNDILLSELQIADIESVINRFVHLTNVCGALMVLTNELSAVFGDQVDALEKL